MTLPITNNTRLSLQKIQKQPSIVLAFEGIDTYIGSGSILSPVRIGDEGLEIGNFIIGEARPIDGQVTSITFESSGGSATSTKINYRLSPDLGVGESVTSLRVAMVDTQSNELLTLLADNEFLGRKVRVLLTPDFTDTDFPEDYVTIFRGIVDDISLPPGMVVFNISHPDQKKRQSIYTSVETTLAENLDAFETGIDLASVSGILAPVLGPDSLDDGVFSGYIRVNDEIIGYAGISGSTLTGCVRGALGTVATTHSSGDDVKTFYRFEENPIRLALKLMLSGWGGNFASGVEVSHFNFVSVSDTVPNAIYFDGVNVEEVYGITAGDYITTTGSAEGANNVSMKVISSVVVIGINSYIVVDGVMFTDEFDSDATISFRSKYDTLPDGLGMSPDEVDVAEHERVHDTFLSGTEYDIYLKDSIDDAKDFISKELYRPSAAYAVPRKARSSIAYMVGPLPTQEIKTLDTSNVLNASKIFKRRSIGRNFYNTIIYKYDEDSLEDEFLRGYIDTNATSKSQIPVGNKSFLIVSKGIRSQTDAIGPSARLLARYAFGANYIENVQVNFETGFNLEVADLVVLDGVSLQLNDAQTGTDTSAMKLYEITSKDFDMKTGVVTLSLTDTAFSIDNRYALISPASYVKSGISGQVFLIESSFASEYGNDEFRKWSRYGEIYVRVRNEDYSVSATGQIDFFSGNQVTLKTSLGFTPSAGMLMELSDYSQATDQIKLLYTHITDDDNDFADGRPPYLMI